MGEEVLEAFLQKAQNQTHRRNIETAFTPVQAVTGKYLADLHQLARADRTACGVTQVYGGDFCSYADIERFTHTERSQKPGAMPP